MRKESIVRIGIVTGMILLVPLVAMQFTHEVTWTIWDFLIAGALLLGTGLAYEYVAMRLHKPLHRVAAGLALAVVLGLVWLQLAAGII